MKKVLITYATYGSGHKTTANYIYETLRENPDLDVKIVDLLDYQTNTTKKSVDAFNKIFYKRKELLFNFLYGFTNHEIINKGYKYYFKWCVLSKRLEHLFIDFNPDIVLSTHFFGSNIASNLKKRGLINPEILTVVTDYKIHRMWMSSYDKNEKFIVANELVKEEMIKRNCYSNNIYTFGLPFNEKGLLTIGDNESIIKKNGLNPYKKRILFFGGGSIGAMMYYKYLKDIIDIAKDFEILFICGHNKDLYDKCKKLQKKHKNLKVYGYINNVYEFMKISDVVISKPGGATVTECLEFQKFMVLLPGMGGQEHYNAKFVLDNKYGVKFRLHFRFRRFMRKFIRDPDKYLKMYSYEKINNKSLEEIAKLVASL